MYNIIILNKMKKQIMKIGSSLGIIFNKNEVKFEGINLGEIVEVHIKKMEEKQIGTEPDKPTEIRTNDSERVGSQ